MNVTSFKTTTVEQNDFRQEILCLMVEGEYRNAAESVLQYAEKLAVVAESRSDKEKKVLLDKSDRIACTYRELLSLASNQNLRELHLTRKVQLEEMRQKANERSDLTSQIEKNVTSFLDEYESLSKLFVIHLTKGNIFNEALVSLQSFPNNKSPYSHEQLLNDLFKLLQMVEPTSSKLSFVRDRRQILGTRYKCERGYAAALDIVNITRDLLLQYEKVGYDKCISYQEIYWHCGIDITNAILGVMNKL